MAAAGRRGPRGGARAAPAQRGGANQLRIIGGQWRGRRLSFPDVPGLRPTTDRVRETVFNWLQGILPGARCLDLFAGSGALGLEAASRGAGEVVLVDADARVCNALRSHVRALGAQGVRIVHGDALAYVHTVPAPFDVVFLDPPFHQHLLVPSFTALDALGLLKPGARVYLEAEASLGEPRLPAGWALARSKQAGEVGYHLAVRVAEA